MPGFDDVTTPVFAIRSLLHRRLRRAPPRWLRRATLPRRVYRFDFIDPCMQQVTLHAAGTAFVAALGLA